MSYVYLDSCEVWKHYNWTVFCMTWPTIFAAALYGKE